jgi:hypothetical protein
MKTIALLAAVGCLISTAVLAQSVGEKTGVNSTLADFNLHRPDIR